MNSRQVGGALRAATGREIEMNFFYAVITLLVGLVVLHWLARAVLRLVLRLAERRWRDRLPPSHAAFHVMVPFADTVNLSREELLAAFRTHFTSDTQVADTESIESGQRAFRIETGRGTFLCVVSDEPLSLDTVNSLALAATPDFTEREQTLLRANQGFVQLRCVENHQPDVECSRTALAVALEILKRPGALGLINVPALSYHPASWVRGVARPAGPNGSDAVNLFRLLTAVHSVDHGNEVWLHTHGMELFGQPDLQIRFADRTRDHYFHDLVCNAAVYMIQTGRTLRSGDTAELAGDGVTFRIFDVELDPDHPFGATGAVEIAPAVTTADRAVPTRTLTEQPA